MAGGEWPLGGDAERNQRVTSVVKYKHGTHTSVITKKGKFGYMRYEARSRGRSSPDTLAF